MFEQKEKKKRKRNQKRICERKLLKSIFILIVQVLIFINFLRTYVIFYANPNQTLCTFFDNFFIEFLIIELEFEDRHFFYL